jgi:hypothetical protein
MLIYPLKIVRRYTSTKVPTAKTTTTAKDMKLFLKKIKLYPGENDTASLLTIVPT